MSEELPPCPECAAEYTYEVDSLYNCPSCGHAWSIAESGDSEDDGGIGVIKDSVGNVLQDGDTVTVIKDLKIKGTNNVVKVGTKVKNIRLVDSDHDIDCKVPGVGPMGLKSEFVRKVSED